MGNHLWKKISRKRSNRKIKEKHLIRKDLVIKIILKQIKEYEIIKRNMENGKTINNNNNSNSNILKI